MKTTFTKIVFYVSVLLSVLVIQSCARECSDPKNTTNKLSSDQKNKLPYSGNDTLVFIGENYDTVTLTGKGRNNNFITKSSIGTQDCDSSKASVETVTGEFNSDKPLLFSGLKIGLYARLIYSPVLTAEAIAVSVANDTVATEVRLLENQYYKDTTASSLGIKENVLKIGKSGNPIVVYYNHTKGIVSIQNGQLWRIIK